MVKRINIEDSYISDTGNWNVAARFSEIKIMKPLAMCDYYENIAQFGYDTLEEELYNYGVASDNLRIMGLKRLVKELLKIIKNSKFAMKKTGTKTEIEKLEERLNGIQKVLPTLSKKIMNLRNKTERIKLNEETFDKVFNMILQIKSDINEPLNKNHLIFTDKEEFDPQAYKKRVIKDAIERG